MDYLTELVNKSIYIIREAYFEFDRPAVLWSTGKDSTAVLQLCREAFYGAIPFPVIHINTGKKFQAMYDFRDKLAMEWSFDLKVAMSQKAIDGVADFKDKLECCTELKTKALQNYVNEKGFDALILAIRRDEHGVRAKERVYSGRNGDFSWDYHNQYAELWDNYRPIKDKGRHTRVHPILHWREIDIWSFIQSRNLPCNPMYFSTNGHRYRSLGCEPCTLPIESSASTIDEIVEELRNTKDAERAGRAQDKENNWAMHRLRTMGYM